VQLARLLVDWLEQVRQNQVQDWVVLAWARVWVLPWELRHNLLLDLVARLSSAA
jgi:hypothetical protein